MQIPSKVSLLGHEIQVVPGTKKMQKKHMTGLADFVAQKIHLSTLCRGEVISQSLQEQTFFHELVHHCMDLMGRQDLNSDEAFVDMLGSLLHQGLGPHMK